jgi:TctA family transporter
MILLFVLLIIVIILVETPELIKEKSYNELIVFSVFLLTGIALGIIYLYDLPYFSVLMELALMLEYQF